MTQPEGMPLGPPEFVIPEDEREILIDTPGLVMWTTRKESE